MGQSGRNSVTETNMARIIASVAMVALASAAPQFQGDSSNAIILQEQRFNAGAGKFGAAYSQEDGVVFREEYDYEYYDDRQPQSVFVNPHDSSHHTKHLLDGNLAGHLAGRVFTTPRPGLVQPVEPRRKSFPPGQIQLDRFPEGFNFNFRSQQG